MVSSTLLFGIIFIAIGVIIYNRQNAFHKVQVIKDIKTKQIAALEVKMASIQNKESREYMDVRKQYCLLNARPETERAKAVTNIQEFVHAIYPTSSKIFDVQFDCSRGTSEFYESEGWQFIIDGSTNHIIEMGEAQIRGKNNIRPHYDYTNLYDKEQAGEIAEKFLVDHKGIFGVDVSHLTREYVGMKDGGDGINPGQFVNYFYKWTEKDKNNKSRNLVNVTITRGGQIVVFDNDAYDIQKNGR